VSAVKGEIVSKASILLADDNPEVLSLVAEILESDYHIVASVLNGRSVLENWSRLTPDVIVLDISMGEPNGIDVAVALRDSGCEAKIVFLTIHSDHDFVQTAMEVGGSGYVVKSQLRSDLAEALTAVLSEKRFVSPCLRYQE
jgi:two-component system NarL family response regulator